MSLKKKVRVAAEEFQKVSAKAMSADDFIKELEKKVTKGVFRIDPPSKMGNTIYIDWYNLSKPQGGAKAENNRIMLAVDGFKREGESDKVKVTLKIRNKFDKLRAKSGSPDKIVDYIAKYLNASSEAEEV